MAISSHPNDSIRTFQSSSRDIAAIRVAAPIFLVIGLVITMLTLASGRLFQAGFLLLANVLVLIVFVSLGRDVRGVTVSAGSLVFERILAPALTLHREEIEAIHIEPAVRQPTVLRISRRGKPAVRLNLRRDIQGLEALFALLVSERFPVTSEPIPALAVARQFPRRVLVAATLGLFGIGLAIVAGAAPSSARPALLGVGLVVCVISLVYVLVVLRRGRSPVDNSR